MGRNSDAAPGRRARIKEIDDLGAKIIGCFFESALKVGLKPHDNERGILPIVADLATTDETVRVFSIGETKAGSNLWGSRDKNGIYSKNRRGVEVGFNIAK